MSVTNSLVPQPPIDLDLHFLDPQQVTLRKVGDDLALSLPDVSYFQVEARRAFPLSNKYLYVTFFDHQEQEIGMLKDIRQLPIEMRKLLEDELEQRYFTARIRRVRSMKEEFGLFRLMVETDKGPREFFLRNLRDNVVRLPNNRIILIDMHGNRFEIRDVSRLDGRSLSNIAKII
ncbi:MAG: DUF1854 domain-containing protein [Armatimonadetes bacterium]|nr:DUF1854 domain-containing protein [Armatimonadota bacterium]